MNIQQLIHSDIEKSIKISGFESAGPVVVGYPTSPTFGDYTSSWPLQAAGNLNQSPIEIAKKIQGNLLKSEVYEAPEIAEPGFLNFRLRKEFLVKHLHLVIAEGGKFGSSSVGKDRTVVVDYSAPNIAKPMHAGQLRNTNLGQSIVKLLSFHGYRTISDNHIGDWGTQFGSLLYAYKTWGDPGKEPSLKELLALYIRFHQESEVRPEIRDLSREEFKKLEQGDKENRGIWEKFRQITLKDLEGIYRELGTKFDVTLGESFYEKDLPKIVDQALGSGAAKRDPDGSVIIPLEDYGLQPFLILKSDGATLYGTRDIATAKYRMEKWRPDRVLYVIASEQSYYLKQLFASLMKLGWGGSTAWTHVSYGLTKLAQGAMSTRSGDMVTAREIIDEAKVRATSVLKEKGSDKSSDDQLKTQVAIGAIKWNDLKITRESEVTFDWDRIFTLEGNSGPYMQYSLARIESILSKATAAEKSIKFEDSAIASPVENEILRMLVRFPEVVGVAAESYSPHHVAHYSFELAQLFSRFYEQVPVLQSEKDLKAARLAVVEAVGTVLKTSLHLLGIETPSKL